MRILGIDHIGIASADLGRHIGIFGDRLRLEIHDIHEKDPYGGLRAAFARVGDTDFELLEDRVPDGEPRPGARGSKIAFIHPKSTGGILIHFVERPDHG
jgi:hypothetical protein